MEQLFGPLGGLIGPTKSCMKQSTRYRTPVRSSTVKTIYQTHPQSDQIRVGDVHSGGAVSLQRLLDRIRNPESECIVGAGSRNGPTGNAHDTRESPKGPREVANGAVAGVVGGQHQHLSSTLVDDVRDQAPQGQGHTVDLEEGGAVEYDALVCHG